MSVIVILVQKYNRISLFLVNIYFITSNKNIIYAFVFLFGHNYQRLNVAIYFAVHLAVI